jgi:Mrp family chromosome partitioning ATPase
LVTNAPSHLSVVIASIRDSAAAAWVASNLACAFAENGESSLLALVSGEQPQAGLQLNAANPALDLDLGDGCRGFSLRSTQTSHISLLDWTAASGLQVAASTAFALAIPKLRDLTRVLLIDSAPLAESSQCLELAQFSTGVVLVLDANRDSRAEIQHQADIIKRAGFRLLGAVLNNREPELPSLIERML